MMHGAMASAMNPTSGAKITKSQCYTDDEDEGEKKSGFHFQQLLEIGAAATTMGMNIYSYVGIGNILSLSACSFATVTSSRVAVNSVKMKSTDSIREVQNHLRNRANDLAAENAQLVEKLDELQVQAFCLKEAQQRLGGMTDGSATSARRIVKLQEDFQKTNNERKQLLKDEVVHEVISFILKADNDKSGDFDKRELGFLTRLLSKKHEIDFDKKKFKNAMKKGGNRASMAIKLAHQLAEDSDDDRDIRVSQNAFALNEDFVTISESMDFDDENSDDDESDEDEVKKVKAKKKKKKTESDDQSVKKKKKASKKADDETDTTSVTSSKASSRSLKSTKGTKSERSRSKSPKSNRRIKSEKSLSSNRSVKSDKSTRSKKSESSSGKRRTKKEKA